MRVYGFNGSDRVQALALVNTLASVVWYAGLTHQLVETSTRQFRRSLEPMVVLDLIPSDTPRTERHFYAQNIGQAPAMNVAVRWFQVDPFDNPEEHWQHLGAILAGEKVRVTESIATRLEKEGRGPFDRDKHMVVAESTDRRWFASIGLMARSGRLVHEPVRYTPSDAELKDLRPQTMNDAIREVIRSLEAQQTKR